MKEETFADYILGKEDWGKKLEVMYYLKRKTNIYYNNSVVFKTLIAKMFIEYLRNNHPEIVLDENLIITARLLCDCCKVENSTDIEEIRNYAKRGAEYLMNLGFDERFCRICEGVNRYTIKENRPIESDLLELADQYGGMLLDRPERIGFDEEEALVLLQYRNLKDKDNQLLDKFVQFVQFMAKVEA